jgi:hypothetical protein
MKNNEKYFRTKYTGKTPIDDVVSYLTISVVENSVYRGYEPVEKKDEELFNDNLPWINERNFFNGYIWEFGFKESESVYNLHIRKGNGTYFHVQFTDDYPTDYDDYYTLLSRFNDAKKVKEFIELVKDKASKKKTWI